MPTNEEQPKEVKEELPTELTAPIDMSKFITREEYDSLVTSSQAQILKLQNERNSFERDLRNATVKNEEVRSTKDIVSSIFGGDIK